MAVAYRQSLQKGVSGANRGLVIAVLSAGLFGMSGSLAASLLRAGWSPAAAVAVRLLVGALVLTIPAAFQLRRCAGAWRAGAPGVVLFGLVPVAAGQLCYFQAVRHLSVAVALLLEYSGILLVVAWQWVRHRQAPGRWTMAGALAAVAGLWLVLDLSGHQRVDPVGVLWGLGAAVALAVYFVVAASREAPLPPLVVAWGGLAVGFAGLLVAAGLGVAPIVAPRVPVVLADARVSWVVPVLGLGVLAGGFAYVTGIIAAKALGARVASFVGLAEVVFAIAYAWLLLGQRLAPTQMVGGALVLAGIALVRTDTSGRPGEQGVGPETAALTETANA